MGNNDSSKAAITPQQLYDRLKPLQEAKGYYFSPDTEMALAILEQMLGLKEDYGYLVCPCRLSSGDREKDKDIMCPCAYREPDVQEHGFCYCGLYASKYVHDNKLERVPVPERRPVSKILAGV